jgi:outer membrane immunogenic protein
MRAGSIAALAPVVAMACTLAVPQAAQGADYLRGSQIEQPVEAPPLFGGGRFDWSGFYFGGGAGVSDTKFKPDQGLGSLANYAFRNTVLGAEGNISSLVGDLAEKRDSGSSFFGVAGYNYLFDDVVLGFEVDYTRSSQEYSLNDFIGRRIATSEGLNDVNITTSHGAKLNDYATARLRMGWAYGRVMPYATIGGAIGRFNTVSTIRSTWFLTRTNPMTGATEAFYAAGYTPTNPSIVGGAKKNVYGFGLSAGAGVEWAVTDNLILRGEYQLVRFAEVEGTTVTVNTARVAAALKF